MNIPQPDDAYRELQKQLLQVLKTEPYDPNPRTPYHAKTAALRDQMEQRFMAAWKLRPTNDQRLLSRYNRVLHSKGFDHTNLYKDESRFLVAVSQPYNATADDIAKSVAAERYTAEVIAADEWAFHFPGRAQLIVVRFAQVS
jgi:hypothetical protein